MIISDTHSFAFIHVPKSAGTTVRNAIAHFDEVYETRKAGLTKEPIGDYVRSIDHVGHVNLAHPPLYFLKDHFPEDLEKLREYRSFAVIREPHERFVSAVSEWIKQSLGVPVSSLSTPEYASILHSKIDELGTTLKAGTLPHHTDIVFVPQTDFLFLEGDQICTSIHTFDSLPELEEELIKLLRERGETLEPFLIQRVNRSYVHRSEATRILFANAKPLIQLARRLLPSAIRSAARNRIYDDASMRNSEFSDDPKVRAFVAKHYADDIKLWLKHS